MLDTVPFFHDLTFDRCIFELIIHQPIHARAIVVLGNTDRTLESISMRHLFASATILAIFLTSFASSPAHAVRLCNGPGDDGLTISGTTVSTIASNCTSVVIPDGILSISDIDEDDDAYERLTSLISLTIGNSVTTIGKNAFKFEDEDEATLLTSLTLPNSLTRIKDNAFSGASKLTTLTLPNGLTRIDEYAFQGLTSLTSLTIPNSVTVVEDSAFADATSLTSLTIGTGVSTMGYYAFKNATALTSVIIPNNIIKIDVGTFIGASSLANVTIGNGVSTIEKRAFQNATSLSRVNFLGAAPIVTLDSINGVEINNAFLGVSAGAKAIVTSANAASFGGAGSNWNGLIVEIAASDAPASDDGAAEAARLAAIAEAARVAAAAEAARQAAAAAAAKQQRELTEILSIIPSLGALALSLGEITKVLTLQKCVKKKQIRYVKKGAKCPKGFVRKR